MQHATSQQYGHQQVPLCRPFEALEIAPLEPGGFGSSSMQMPGVLANSHNLGAVPSAALALPAIRSASSQANPASRFPAGPLALAALQGGAAGRGWASGLGECHGFLSAALFRFPQAVKQSFRSAAMTPLALLNGISYHCTAQPAVILHPDAVVGRQQSSSTACTTCCPQSRAPVTCPVSLL